MKAAGDSIYTLWEDLAARHMFQMAPGSLDGRVRKVWDGVLTWDDEGEEN